MSLDRYIRGIELGENFIYKEGHEEWVYKTRMIPNAVNRLKAVSVIVSAIKAGKDIRTALEDDLKYIRRPIDIEESVFGKAYLDKSGEVYPKVMDELIAMNAPQYQEIVLTGGIGPLSCDTELLSLS